MRYMFFIPGGCDLDHDAVAWSTTLQPSWTGVVVRGTREQIEVDARGANGIDDVTSLVMVDCRDIDDAIRLSRVLAPERVVEIRPVR